MDGRRLLEEFDVVAGAPGGVERLRRLVVSLAIQGRLVEQRSDDGSADELLHELSEARARFRADHPRRRLRNLQPVEESDHPFAAPDAWEWVRMGSVAWPQAGFAFKSRNFVERSDGVPLIRIRDITSGSTQVNYVGDFRPEFLVEPGDYLVGMDGLFRVAQWEGPQALLNQRVSRLVFLGSGLARRFFAIALQRCLDELHGSKSYTTVQHLSGKQIENALVPLPPLAEQRRIVARVDELMALCDELEAKQERRRQVAARLPVAAYSPLTRGATRHERVRAWGRIEASFNELTNTEAQLTPLNQSILSLAIRGRLVRQDLEELPVEIGSAAPTEPFTIPVNWRWVELGSLMIEGPANGLSPRAVDYPTAVKTLKLTATTSGVFDGRHFKYLDVDLPEKSPYWLEPGDFLVQRGNTREFVGMAAVFDGPPRTFVYPDLMIRFRVASGVDRRFLHSALVSPYARGYFSSEASGTSKSMPKISQKTLRVLPVPLPPLPEQQRIAARLEGLTIACDALREGLAGRLSVSERLASALTAAS